MPLAALTAHQAIERAGLRRGETFFVPAGAGGVGHFAIQLAVERGARVIATRLAAQPRLPARAGRRARRLHATATSPPASASSRPATGADAALDIFGGDGREHAFASLRRGGRLVSLASPAPEPREGYEIHYIFVRPSGYDLGEHITPLVQEGRLRPARRGGLPARARRRGARAPRAGPRARQARAHDSVGRSASGVSRGDDSVGRSTSGLSRPERRAPAPPPARAPAPRGCAAAGARWPAARSPRPARARSRSTGAPRRGRRCGRSGPCRRATAGRSPGR